MSNANGRGGANMTVCLSAYETDRNVTMRVGLPIDVKL